MSSTGVAKLVDFGLAGAESPGQAGTSDEVQRALEYAALERGTNAPRNDPRSDIFFAGAIYYELLAGSGPWARSRDREERQLLSRYTNTRPIDSIKPDLSPSIVRVCRRMMEVSPSARYQSATEVVRELRALMLELGETIDTPPLTGKPLMIEIKSDFRLLVVDSMKKRCAVMKEYFEKHGFDVEFLRAPDVALNKLKTSPPDGILFLADNDPLAVLEIYAQVQAYARSQKVPCLAVFAEKDEGAVKKKIVSTRFGATMFQPATLRAIRNHFEDIGAVTR